MAISVVIYINKKPIKTISAQRIKGDKHERCIYLLEKEIEIKHHYDDGAVILAKKMIDEYIFLEQIRSEMK